MADGPQIPRGLSPHQVVKALETLGFRSTRKTPGSHDTLVHADGRRGTVVRGHSADYPIGTLRDMLGQAGISTSDFLVALGGKHKRTEKQRMKRASRSQ